MSVTAKQIAKELNISAAAVSMALNNKPGVSTETRKIVIETAKRMGYDFSKTDSSKNDEKIIAFVFFHKNFVFETPFFTELALSIENVLKENGYKLIIHHIHDLDNVEEQLEIIKYRGCSGMILLGTVMSADQFKPFEELDIPLVLLDTYIPSANVDCVVINNIEGSRSATDYLIKKCKSQPGYIHATQYLRNFDERSDGFYKAIRQNGYASSKSIVHHVSSSTDGAYADMMDILNNNEPIAKCYFADNDEIAIGAMRAFKDKGYKIPEDISIVGFDNMSYSIYVDPPLTTVNVPKAYMGKVAAQRLIEIMKEEFHYPIKIEINTNLIIRKSI